MLQTGPRTEESGGRRREEDGAGPPSREEGGPREYETGGLRPDPLDQGPKAIGSGRSVRTAKGRAVRLSVMDRRERGDDPRLRPATI